MGNQYINRIVIGAVLFLAVWGFNALSPNVWGLVILLLSLIGFQEFKSMCNKMGVYPLANWINFFILVFILSPLFVVHHNHPHLIYIFHATLLVASYVIIFPRILLKTTYTKFEDITASLWAIFQLGLLPSFFTWIRIMDAGFAYTMAIVITISANDIAALFLGKKFGKTKLAAKISPNKTVAGSLGGLFCGGLGFLMSAKGFGFDISSNFLLRLIDCCNSVLPGLDYSAVIIFALGFLFSVIAQIGDLLVSLLKREAGVKDSGTLLFSHGGILDRVDSHFFAVWFAYFIFAYLLH